MMKRAWAMMVTAAGLLTSGCGVAAYEKRMEVTLERRQTEQKLDTFLQTAAQGKFKALAIWVRPPQPMEAGKLQLTEQPGMYDLTATFQGSPAPPAPGPGESAAPAMPPLRLHVLARTKAKKTAAKKGGDQPEAAVANRGSFVSDVRALMAAELGPEAADKSPQPVNAGGNAFRRVVFRAASGDTIRAYFAEANKGELEAVLIFDIPPPLLKTPMVTEGVELCLGAFSMGAPARKLFSPGAKTGGGGGGTGANF